MKRSSLGQTAAKLGLSCNPSDALGCYWAKSLRAFETLAFPWQCPVCGGDGEGPSAPFCLNCRSELVAASGSSCWRCASPVGPWADVEGGCAGCRGRSLGFDAAIALGPYRGPIRDLCLRLKHLNNGWLARWLIDLLVEARSRLREEVERSPGAVVAAVPLHWSRRLTRGYNQADELARALARSLSLRRHSPLRRVIRTPKLATLGRVERAELLRGAFKMNRFHVNACLDRTVLLVDDILTTGATCGAAARALKRAGAARVVAVVIGRAEGRV